MKFKQSKYDEVGKLIVRSRDVPDYVFENMFPGGSLSFHRIYEHGGFEVQIIKLEEAGYPYNKSIIFDRLTPFPPNKPFAEAIHFFDGTTYKEILRVNEKGEVLVKNNELTESQVKMLEEQFNNVCIKADIAEGRQKTLT